MNQRNDVPTSYITAYGVEGAGGTGGSQPSLFRLGRMSPSWLCGRRVGYRTDHASAIGRCKVGFSRASMFNPIPPLRLRPHKWRAPYRTGGRRACERAAVSPRMSPQMYSLGLDIGLMGAPFIGSAVGWRGGAPRGLCGRLWPPAKREGRPGEASRRKGRVIGG